MNLVANPHIAILGKYIFKIMAQLGEGKPFAKRNLFLLEWQVFSRTASINSYISCIQEDLSVSASGTNFEAFNALQTFVLPHFVPSAGGFLVLRQVDSVGTKH